MQFERSEELTALLDKYDIDELMDTLYDVYSSTCTTGYNNDGSTGFEIFSNGVELRDSAEGRPIFIYAGNNNIALFFIGTEEEIVTMVTECLREAFDEE